MWVFVVVEWCGVVVVVLVCDVVMEEVGIDECVVFGGGYGGYGDLDEIEVWSVDVRWDGDGVCEGCGGMCLRSEGVKE